MASFNLGRLTLDLVAKTADFISGMSKAERAAKAYNERLKKQFKELRAEANKTGKILAGIGAGFAAYGVKEIIQNTIDLEKQQAQLAAVLKSTGEVAGFTQDELNKMGQALSDASTFDTNSITKAQTTLLAFSGIVGDKLVKAQQAAADMATRMGSDISSAAEMVGRALDVPSQGVTSLTRQGFRFSEQQKALIKWLEETGRKTEAQDIILSALEESYDGAAKAARDTFGGALTAVKHNISSLLMGENGSLDSAKAALEELNKVLTDPKTKEQFAEIAQSVINGLTDIVENADKAVAAFKFIASAIEGVKTAFKLAADTGILFFESIKRQASDFDIGLLNPLTAAHSIARGIKKELKDANSVTSQAAQNMHNTLMNHGVPRITALPPKAPPANDDKITSTKTGKSEEELQREHQAWLAAEKRRIEQEKAAKAAAEAYKKQQEAINKEITALERAAKTWGMNTGEVKLYDLTLQGANKSQLEQAKNQLAIVEKLEQAQETRENYLSLVKSLQTEEERRKETLAEQLALIKEMEQLTGESDKETFKRAAMGSFDDNAPADKYKNDSNPFEAMDEATKAQKEWYAQQLELLNEYRQQRQDLTEEWDEKEAEIKRQHEAGLAAIQKAKWDEGLDSASIFFKGLTALQGSESKKARAIGKAAAIAEATINTYRSAVGAYAALAPIFPVGPVLGAAAAAAAVAAGMANVAQIRGVAHSGIDSVPQTGTWLLEKGERVTTAKTSAKLDATLERIGQQQRENARSERGRGRSAAVINQTIQVQGQVDGRTASHLAAENARQQRLVNARFG